MANHTFETLMRRLSKAGFTRPIARTAILPDWWDDDCAKDPALLPAVEFSVARFLGMPLTVVRDPSEPLHARAVDNVALRGIHHVPKDRLAPAIHLALSVAEAAVRNLRNKETRPETPPKDALEWRKRINQPGPSILLDDILADLWGRAIPVIPMETLPSPNFQGMACVIDGHPVIVIGQKFKAPGRVAFHVSHEVAHIAAGDCTDGQIIVEGESSGDGETDSEQRADGYAGRVLRGGTSPQLPRATSSAQSLANVAATLEKQTGAEASLLISEWAQRNDSYGTATAAVNALGRSSGARESLRQQFDRHVDVMGASESDRALLRCVHTGAFVDAPAA